MCFGSPLGCYYDFRFKFQLCHMVKESLRLGVSVNFMICSCLRGDKSSVFSPPLPPQHDRLFLAHLIVWRWHSCHSQVEGDTSV